MKETPEPSDSCILGHRSPKVIIRIADSGIPWLSSITSFRAVFIDLVSEQVRFLPGKSTAQPSYLQEATEQEIPGGVSESAGGNVQGRVVEGPLGFTLVPNDKSKHLYMLVVLGPT